MIVLLKKTARAWRMAACLLLFAGAAGAVAPARAQQDQQARLDRLENEIQTLSRAVFRGEQPPAATAAAMQSGGASTSSADTEVRLTQMETAISNLTGRVEQDEYAVQQLQKSISELQGRTVAPVSADNGSAASTTAPGGFDSELYGSNNPAPVTTPPVTLSGPNAAAPANAPTTRQLGTLEQNAQGAMQASPSDPVNQYQKAFDLLRDRKYDDAEKAFTSFLAQNPDSNLAPNAQYWLGETFYARNNFERAARVFAESYQKYPKGPKGPDSLLKLAMALAGMGKKDDACLSIAQLRQEYSTGAGAVMARADQEAASLGCH